MDRWLNDGPAWHMSRAMHLVVFNTKAADFMYRRPAEIAWFIAMGSQYKATVKESDNTNQGTDNRRVEAVGRSNPVFFTPSESEPPALLTVPGKERRQRVSVKASSPLSNQTIRSYL